MPMSRHVTYLAGVGDGDDHLVQVELVARQVILVVVVFLLLERLKTHHITMVLFDKKNHRTKSGACKHQYNGFI